MNTVKCTFFADPGHAWLRAPRCILETHGIADRISSYSYQRGKWAYLEEDRDAGIFLGAMKAAGVEVSIRERTANGPSAIRSYDRWRASN